MSNPFDDPDGSWAVLVNSQGQYCLWPATTPVPKNWGVASGPADRAACLAFVAGRWTDMRPRALSQTTRNHS